jgi:hypothetical protein
MHGRWKRTVFPSCCWAAALGVLAIPAGTAAAEEILIDPMGAQSPWVVTPSLNPEKNVLEAVKRPARPGAAESLQLSYDVEKNPRPGIHWRGDPLPGRATSCSFWLWGDESGHRLEVRFEDAAGRWFDVPLERIQWRGWQQVQVPLDESRWNPVCRFAEEPAEVHWPITLRDILIVRGNDRMPQGKIAFSELRAKCVVHPLDRVVMRATSGARGNVFYLPAAAVLRLALANPTETAFDGRLEIVLEDWLGRTFNVDQGPLQLPEKGNVSRDVQLPIRKLGSYRAWVRFVVGGAAREVSQRLAISSHEAAPAALDPESPFAVGMYADRDSPPWSPADLAQSLVLAREAGVKWARFDGMAAALANPAETGSAGNSPSWIDAPPGGAVRLPASTVLNVPDSSSLDRPCDTGELTLAVQLKFFSFDDSGKAGDILVKGDAGRPQYRLSYLGQRGHLALSLADGSGGRCEVWCAKTAWGLDRWYQIVVSHSRSERRVRWWVDGAAAGENQTPDNTLIAGAKMLQIGGNLDVAIDDLAVYDRAIAPPGLAEAKPVAQWHFDEKLGPRAADSSGNHNHAFFQQPLPILDEAARAGISSYAMLLNVAGGTLSRPTPGTAGPSYGMPRLDEWSAAVEATVARFAPQGVHTWEVWNEPNQAGFWSPQPDPDQYYRLLVASYRAIKKADPQATVLGCSLAGPTERGPAEPCKFAETVFQLGGGKVMDAIAIHPYRRFSPEATDYVGGLKAIRALVAKQGGSMPIWISEIGWGNDASGCSEAWSAKMLPRAYLLAIVEGVKNIAWRDFRDRGDDSRQGEENCGLLWHDLTPKPGYFALRTVGTELAGMRFLRAIASEEPCTLLLFGNASRRTLVAWAHQAQIPLALRVGDAQRLESVSLMGNRESLAARDGAVLFSLSDVPVFLRDVPAEVEAVFPISGSPAVVKLSGGQAARIRVTFRNPFDQPLRLLNNGHAVTLAPRGTQKVLWTVSARAAAAWQPPVWQSEDEQIELPLPTRVAVLKGQQKPIFVQRDEVHKGTVVKQSQALNAGDELTLVCRVRSAGPSGKPQVLATKAGGGTRNFAVLLDKTTGVLALDASFERLSSAVETQGGPSLFDGKWHLVGVTYSMHDAEVRFFVDGAMVGRRPLDGGALKPNTAAIVLGGGFVDEQGRSRAVIRDLGIWNRALSAEELSAAGRSRP